MPHSCCRYLGMWYHSLINRTVELLFKWTCNLIPRPHPAFLSCSASKREHVLEVHICLVSTPYPSCWLYQMVDNTNFLFLGRCWISEAQFVHGPYLKQLQPPCIPPVSSLQWSLPVTICSWDSLGRRSWHSDSSPPLVFTCFTIIDLLEIFECACCGQSKQTNKQA